MITLLLQELTAGAPLWSQIITPLFAFMGLVFSGVMAYLMAKLNTKQTAAAVAAERVAVQAGKAAEAVVEVKKTLETNTDENNKKLEGLATVAQATHTLVNNNMSVQLQLNSAVTRRLANLTKDPVDIEAAAVALELYAEHQRKQALVDAQPGTHDAKAGKPEADISAARLETKVDRIDKTTTEIKEAVEQG